MITVIVKPHLDYADGIYLSTLHKRQNGCCFYCNQPFTGKYTKDHLFPRCKGFTLLGNTVLSCVQCNYEKGGRMPTIQEIVKAVEVYKFNLDRCIIQVRHGKPVVRITH